MAQRIGQQVAERTAQHQPVTQYPSVPLLLQADGFLFRQRIVELQQRRHLVLDGNRFPTG
ncbi:hypothetical protein D3C71_2150250 [compost metagenome]